MGEIDEAIRDLTDDQLRDRLMWLDAMTHDGLERLAKVLLRGSLHEEAKRRGITCRT
jgi:hypothetical protein